MSLQRSRTVLADCGQQSRSDPDPRSCPHCLAGESQIVKPAATVHRRRRDVGRNLDDGRSRAATAQQKIGGDRRSGPQQHATNPPGRRRHGAALLVTGAVIGNKVASGSRYLRPGPSCARGQGRPRRGDHELRRRQRDEGAPSFRPRDAGRGRRADQPGREHDHRKIRTRYRRPHRRIASRSKTSCDTPRWSARRLRVGDGDDTTPRRIGEHHRGGPCRGRAGRRELASDPTVDGYAEGGGPRRRPGSRRRIEGGTNGETESSPPHPLSEDKMSVGAPKLPDPRPRGGQRS